MTDPYDFWRRALAGEEVGGPTLPVHEDKGHPGFWRMRTSRAGEFVPVATWIQDGEMLAVTEFEGRQVGIKPEAIWTRICRHPLSEENYRSRIATGKWWDEDSATTASLIVPSIGHNNGPTDPAEILSEQITAALAGVEAYAEVKDDETAARAQSLRSRLLELSREADKTREAQKAPHFEAGKAVDALFQPLVKSSKAGAETIAKALSAFETAKAREAARLAKIAEEARRKALEEAQAKAPIGVTVVPEPLPASAAVLAAPAPIRGAYGRGASVKAVKIATVVNMDLAYAFLKSQPELIELIQKLAQKMVTNGLDVPGVTVEEQRKVV